MRRITIPALAAVAALAASPALAQSSGQQQAQQPAPQPKATAMGKDKLRQSLEKAGFSEVRVVDATYMVSARTAEGERVMMFIDPPSAMTMGGQAQQGGSGAGDAAKGGQQKGAAPGGN